MENRIGLQLEVEKERDAVLQVEELMLVSARTAPKSGGVDDVSTAIV